MSYPSQVSHSPTSSAVLDADLRAIFREKLEAELRSLTAPRNARAVDDGEPVAPSADISTQQALDIERDVETALDGRTQATVDAIRVSLARLDDGTFGTCHDCGDEMPFARLMALPHALRCLDCQAEHERQR